ncbi:MAG TPA: hypothetical protein VF363_05290 [Candidatus Eisenbacteria bacterium]
MPPTSTKQTATAVAESRGTRDDAIARARRRVQEGHYDRPEVRRIIAALILRRAARRAL